MTAPGAGEDLDVVLRARDEATPVIQNARAEVQGLGQDAAQVGAGAAVGATRSVNAHRALGSAASNSAFLLRSLGADGAASALMMVSHFAHVVRAVENIGKAARVARIETEGLAAAQAVTGSGGGSLAAGGAARGAGGLGILGGAGLAAAAPWVLGGALLLGLAGLAFSPAPSSERNITYNQTVNNHIDVRGAGDGRRLAEDIAREASDATKLQTQLPTF